MKFSKINITKVVLLKFALFGVSCYNIEEVLNNFIRLKSIKTIVILSNGSNFENKMEFPIVLLHASLLESNDSHDYFRLLNQKMLFVIELYDISILYKLLNIIPRIFDIQLLLLSTLDPIQVLNECNKLNYENVKFWNTMDDKFYIYQPYYYPTKLIELTSEDLFSKVYFKDYNYRILTVSVSLMSEIGECVGSAFNCFFLGIFGEKYKVRYIYKYYKDTQDPDISVEFIIPKGYAFIYPIDSFETTAIVPIVPENNLSKMYSLPFQKDLWAAIGLFVVYFGLVLTLISYLYNKKLDVISSFIKSVSFMLQSGVNINSNKSIISLIYIFIMAFTICITTIYSVFLGNFFTVPIKKSNYTILYNKDVGSGLKISNKDLFEGPYTLLPAEDEVVTTFYRQLNTSMGYIINKHQWRRDFYFQKKMKNHLFKPLTPWRSANSYVAPMVPTNSFIRRNMDMFFLRYYSVGLNDKMFQVTNMRNLSRMINAVINEHERTKVNFYNSFCWGNCRKSCVFIRIYMEISLLF